MTGAASKNGRWLGYAEAVAAACLWGSSGIFAVHLFRLGVPPESVAILRPVVGTLVLLLAFGISRPAALRVDLRGFLVLGVGGGVAVGVFQLAYQLSTATVGVPTTVALLYLAPAVVIAASGPLLGEWPTRARVGLVGVTLVGVWLSVSGARAIPSEFGPAGLVWGVLAGLSYATYTLFGRFAAPRYGPTATVTYSTLGACVVLFFALPQFGADVVLPASPKAWGTLVAFGVLTIALAQFLFFDALGRIEASRASLATAIEPVVAALLATLLLSQGLNPLGWAGIALVVAGVVGVGLSAPDSD
ncbi:MAG: EamA family transporter [Gemmatimonadales bacterium]|jgi:DME family drug/metabolite transporter|nr:EamA family transporter [Gemmatimonadales bacterium]NCG32774.1 EamA family transporter [Pseudomonadota bacterium]MBT3498622.1 EamA family transporter [Gemmatimonadales bacterium]MBT3775428.1 EamA family transporter [Gemmatimonadales bacterium]MBT3958643.1 EamA family transporter [Gemmatimonadales bacterium]